MKDGVFAAKNLTSVRRVFRARNRGPVKCTPLRWKSEFLKRPVFPRCDAISGVSEWSPMQYHKLNNDMGRQSLDYGCEKALGCKVWRRTAANAVNGNASDAVRDQMMRPWSHLWTGARRYDVMSSDPNTETRLSP